MLGIRTVNNLRNLQRLAVQAARQQVRYRSEHSQRLPFNTGIVFVPQQEAWMVERFGKFHRCLEPGLNFLIPVVDSIKYVQSLKELAVNIDEQSAITSDNVGLGIDGVLYVKVVDPYKASYGVEDAEFAISQLAQTTMRSELGKITLDTVFKERELLNVAIVDAINKAAEAWGLDCKRYEIRNIKIPKNVEHAMHMQVEAERKRRAAVLESEGVRTAGINVAEGQKQARILQSEAFRAEQVNQAKGEAEALLAKARARATAIEVVAQALAKQNGHNAVSISLAEQYISAFGNLAKEGNTILLPSNTGDITNMVAQAMAIYKNIGEAKALPSASVEHKEDEITDSEMMTSVDLEHKGMEADHSQAEDEISKLESILDPFKKDSHVDTDLSEHDIKRDWHKGIDPREK